MIDISLLLQTVAELQKIAVCLGVTAHTNGDTISFIHDEKVYCSFIPWQDGIKEELPATVYIYSNVEYEGLKIITKTHFDRLVQIKNKINDNTIWYTILSMVFSGINSVADSIYALEAILKNKYEIPESSQAQEKKANKPTHGKDAEASTEYIHIIRERLGLSELKSIGRKIYCDLSTNTAVLCLYSKSYSHSKKGPDFWFSYHPYQKDKLDTFATAYIALCLVDENEVLIVPKDYLHSKLEFLHQTEKDGKMYWHIRIDKFYGKYLFRVPNKGRDNIQAYASQNAEDGTREEIKPTDNNGEVQLIKITKNRLKSIKG